MLESESQDSLIVLSGPLKGRTLTLDERVDDILIGSDPDCKLWLDAPNVSPIHGRLWIDFEGAMLHDTHSPFGLYVNDDRVNVEAPVRNGDVIWLGPPGEPTSIMILCRFGRGGSGAGVAPALQASSFAVPAEGAVVADEPAWPATEPSAVAEAPWSETASAVEVPPPAAPVETHRGIGEVEPAAPYEIEPEPSAAADDMLELAPEEPQAAPEPEPAPVMVDDFVVEETPATAAAFPDFGEPAAEETEDFGGLVLAPPAASVPSQDATPTSDADFFSAISASETPVAAGNDAFDFDDFGPPPPAAPDFGVATSPETVFDLAAPAHPSFDVAAPQPGVADEVSVSAVPPAAGVPTPAAAEPPVAPEPPPLVPPRPLRRPGPPDDEATSPATAAPRPREPLFESRMGARARPPWLAAAAVAGALAVAAVGALGYRAMSAPKLTVLQPARAQAGEVLTLQGSHFPASPADVSVLFGERAAAVRSATAGSLQVVVPELLTGAELEKHVPVRVRVDSREAGPLDLVVYAAARVSGLRPSVAMPGDEITIDGAQFKGNVTVLFAGRSAEVLETTPTALRVRVPTLEGAPGTSVPVAVAMGRNSTPPISMLLGRPPLVTELQPKTASVGDVVKVAGRGFAPQASDNVVRIGRVPALVVSAAESELSVVVPRAAGDSVPVEVQVTGGRNVGQAALAVAGLSDPVELKFFAEAADTPDRAFVSSPLGPLFLFARTAERSAGERAVSVARQLTTAAITLKASPSQDVEVRGLEDNPSLGLTGQREPIVEVTPEDAAAYGVAPGRLARWWGALLRDTVRLVARGQSPDQVAAVAPAEGRVLNEFFLTARRTARAGMPRSFADDARRRAAIRSLAIKVPASVPGPRGGEAAPAGGPLRLEGIWTGNEVEKSGARRSISIVFRGGGGTYSLEGAVTASMSLQDLRQDRGTVRFVVPFRGRREYFGRWDGRRLTGTISSTGAARGDIGTFELSPQRR